MDASPVKRASFIGFRGQELGLFWLRDNVARLIARDKLAV